MWKTFTANQVFSPSSSFDDSYDQGVETDETFGVETVMDDVNDGVETVRSMRSDSYNETDQSSNTSLRERIPDNVNDDNALKSCSFVNGTRVCLPYKRERLQKQIRINSPGSRRRHAIIETLRELGVKVFIIDSNSTKSTSDIVTHMLRVVEFVSRENSNERRTGPLGFQRCLLYQDQQGRLFNLTLPNHTVGPAETYKNYLESFSGREAMIAATVICRTLACISADNISLRPAYLSLILGLALTEEMSLSWLNASMLIRATPSVSAYSLTSPIGSDGLRKLVLFALALAGAATGSLQVVLTIGGITGALLILLANLGARAWHFMRWKPLNYTGRGSFFLAFVLAVLTGLVLPYMGHRSIAVGGKYAMEYVIQTAVIVAVIFVISDYDDLQKFLVFGSESSELCNQDPVNIAVGGWWSFTLLSSLCLVRNINYVDEKPSCGEKLLEEDHASPVGYKVPSLPDYEIDPSLAKSGSKWVPLQLEFIIGVILAVGVGGAIVALGYTSWDEDFYDEVSNTLEGNQSYVV